MNIMADITTPDTFPSLLAGYSVIWGLIVAYLVFLSKRIRLLEEQFKSSLLPKGVSTNEPTE
jgi:CcmD family protein